MRCGRPEDHIMTGLDLRQVTKRFGDRHVIHGVDLKVEPGDFCVFFGLSGCGQSTLLRMIARLEETSSGSIGIGGRDMTRIGPANRGVAMVFQSDALYPHLTEAENMGYSLRIAGRPRAEIRTAVDEVAAILELSALLDRKPRALSGGQRQRVASGRAILRKPHVFLFDEPLSNLDAELRVSMRVEIASLHRRLGTTMIYVTDDQVEAMTLADRLVLLRAGRIEQERRPLDLYNDPDNSFVAGFPGNPRMNFLASRVAALREDGILAEVEGTGEQFFVSVTGKRLKPGEPVDVGIRPRHIRPNAAGPLVLVVDSVEHHGSGVILYGRTGAGVQLTMALYGEVSVSIPTGSTIRAGFSSTDAVVFGADGTRVR
jgi:lactose/L-arabinose transport system ATP-binding protein